MMWFFGFMSVAFCVACVVAYRIDQAHLRALKEQEARREQRVAKMEELTKEMAAIMRGLRRMNDREGKNERENANG